jgi:uncharacterized protein YjiS (DUF1127 family)
MTTQTRNSTRTTALPTIGLRGFIRWILQADARYRAAQKLKNAPDFRLSDMGMSRRDAESAFQKR